MTRRTADELERKARTAARLALARLAVTVTAAVAGLGSPRPARADQTLTFDAEVPRDGPDHFFVPFPVPAGIREIEIRHDDLSDANILDFGLEDPRRGAAGYRGWGGGTREPAIVGEQAASRAYVPGPIAAGEWRVIVGKALIASWPARYHLEVILRNAPTLRPQPERAPYVPVPALRRGRRYYAGDLHVHSRESTDARPELLSIARFARGRGLDFVEISDHNSVTQLDYFAAAQAQSPELLLVPGIEVTTYAGHANAVFATRFVEHKIGLPGVTIAGTAAAVRAQGALLSINHPTLDLGEACLGCAWRQPLDPAEVAAIELGTGGQSQGALLFTPGAVRLWESLLEQGRHVAAVGGSDDHQGGQGTGRSDSPIGSPTTLILADELSVGGLLAGLRQGRTVVKLQGPDDPMAELTAGELTVGDTLAVRSARLKVRVTGTRGAPGHSVRFVKDGAPQELVAVDADPFELEQDVVPPRAPDREGRWRVEVLIDKVPRTVTSPLYVRYDPSGPDVLGVERAGPGPGPGPGCEAAPAGASAPGAGGRLAAVAVGLLGLWGRATRRRARGRSWPRAAPG